MKILALVFSFLVSSAFAEKPISLLALQPGDSIDVIFASQGCFHQTKDGINFERKGSIIAKVYEYESGYRKLRGSVVLKEEEVAGVDRLLEFYRNIKQPGGCTTTDQITLILKSTEAVKAREFYTDGTCSTYEMKQLTTFTDIIAKVIPKRPAIAP